MSVCRACQAPLETPLGCSKCGALFTPPPGLSPFEIMGLERQAHVDSGALQKRLTRLARIVHPDFFSDSDQPTRQLAERHSAELNRAFEILSDPVQRAEWIVHDLGAPSERDSTPVPRAFLMQVLEWNELLDAAQAPSASAADMEAVRGLSTQLDRDHSVVLQQLLASLDPVPARAAPALRGARELLNQLRYLDRARERAAQCFAARGLETRGAARHID